MDNILWLKWVKGWYFFLYAKHMYEIRECGRFLSHLLFHWGLHHVPMYYFIQQVPQYVLEEAELQGSGAEVHIVVTQPRRIAAIRFRSLCSYFGVINFRNGLTWVVTNLPLWLIWWNFAVLQSVWPGSVEKLWEKVWVMLSALRVLYQGLEEASFIAQLGYYCIGYRYTGWCSRKQLSFLLHGTHWIVFQFLEFKTIKAWVLPFFHEVMWISPSNIHH